MPLIVRRAQASSLRTVTTSFPLTENPISEGGLWSKRGLADGVHWTNPRTTPGIFFGTQTGDNGTDDSVAIVGGAWTNDQDVSGVVHIGTRPGDFAEIELLMRFSISTGVATGYECYFAATAGSGKYGHIARWDGWNGGTNQTIYTNLVDLDGANFPDLNNGDVIRATMVGTVITVYQNGTQRMTYNTASDGVKYSSGNPGCGVFAQTQAATNNWGWSSYTAKDYGA